jgi:hypothetical protein
VTIAALYWRLSRAPAFGSVVEPEHLKASVVAALVAALIGVVFLTLTFVQLANASAFVVVLSTVPLSAIGSVAQITIVVLAAEMVFAGHGERPELFGWMAAFAAGMVLIAVAEVALIGAVSVLDAQTPSSIGTYLWHKLITLPQVVLSSAVVGLVYGYVVGARDFSWMTNER